MKKLLITLGIILGIIIIALIVIPVFFKDDIIKLVESQSSKYIKSELSIGDIRHWGRELNNIEPLIRQTARTARVGDEAKESFDYLLDSGASYVVVLNADDTIAGIVTKTSVARSVAENLWGDAK